MKRFALSAANHYSEKKVMCFTALIQRVAASQSLFQERKRAAKNNEV